MSRVVLVVDDEPLVLEHTASMLEDFGCEVITAVSGNDALEKLSLNRRIEILITDINMPGMSGYELTERAKHMRERLKVIVHSLRDGRPLHFAPVRDEHENRSHYSWTFSTPGLQWLPILEANACKSCSPKTNLLLLTVGGLPNTCRAVLRPCASCCGAD